MQRVIAVLLGAAFVVSLEAQSPGLAGRGSSATGRPGLILGRVVDASSDAPIPNVVVALAGGPLTSSIRVLTDLQGRFLLRNVPKGSFTLRNAGEPRRCRTSPTPSSSSASRIWPVSSFSSSAA